MLSQDVCDIAAKGYYSKIFCPRYIEAGKHKSFGDAMSAKPRGDLRVRENHSIALLAIFGHRQLPADLDLKAAFRLVVNDGGAGNFHRLDR